ncbi:MAG: hypothetical protein ACYTG3_20890 [Planctomycetota bacterium]
MTPRQWEAWLADRLGRRVEVAYGRARTVPVQVVDDHRTLRVRLHRFFAEAPPEVRDALGAWLRAGRRARRACGRLDAWIDARLEALPPPPPRRARLRQRGEHHDLAGLAAPLFDAEFILDFEERGRPGVTWGRRGRSRARRSLHLGSYAPAGHVVRVHPVLDRPSVPAWFVRYVLFHEILHAALPGADHGPAFRARERAYPDYGRAAAWQRVHIGGLIREARRGGRRA